MSVGSILRAMNGYSYHVTFGYVLAVLNRERFSIRLELVLVTCVDGR